MKAPIKTNRGNYPGVTLIELIIVIGVIGILASGLLIAINPVKQLQRARDTRRKADLAQIQQALELYRSNNDGYPPTGSITCGDQLDDSGSVVYLRTIPCDPKTSGWPAYSYTPSGTSAYTITACLENSSDTDPGVGGSCGTGGIRLTRYNP